MWQNTLYRKIASRTGYDMEEVDRLLTLFFSRHGVRKHLRNKDPVMLLGIMKLSISKRHIKWLNTRKAARHKKAIAHQKAYQKAYWKKRNLLIKQGKLK